VISTFPYIVPPDLTNREAAAAPSSQTFMLIGTFVLLPVILAYTALTYCLFHGKVAEGAAYHIGGLSGCVPTCAEEMR
jgi:cytochrome d ubiquinol oxidase subunit II